MICSRCCDAGKSASCEVREARNVITGEEVAVKCVLRTCEEVDSSITKEVSLMRELDHHHVLRFIDYVCDERQHSIVMELAPNGDLYGEPQRCTHQRAHQYGMVCVRCDRDSRCSQRATRCAKQHMHVSQCFVCSSPLLQPIDRWSMLSSRCRHYTPVQCIQQCTSMLTL